MQAGLTCLTTMEKETEKLYKFKKMQLDVDVSPPAFSQEGYWALALESLPATLQ